MNQIYTGIMVASSLPTCYAYVLLGSQLKILINLYSPVTSYVGLAAGPTEFIFITSRYSLLLEF